MKAGQLKLITLILVACAALVACSGNTANTNGVSGANGSANIPSNPAEKGAYPQEVVDEFMTSCVEAGGNAKFCTCMIEKVQAKYSLEEFSVIESKISAGTTPEEFVEFSGRARAQCVK